MSHEYTMIKEEAILFAKEKIEDASETLSDILPEVSEELRFLEEELNKEILIVKRERMEISEKISFPEECAG